MISLPVAKLAINIFASLGVSKVFSDIIRNNTNVVTTGDVVKVWTGSLVLGTMVAEHASNHVNGHIDDVVEWYNKRKNENENESKDESKDETPPDPVTA